MTCQAISATINSVSADDCTKNHQKTRNKTLVLNFLSLDLSVSICIVSLVEIAEFDGPYWCLLVSYLSAVWNLFYLQELSLHGEIGQIHHDSLAHSLPKIVLQPFLKHNCYQ